MANIKLIDVCKVYGNHVKAVDSFNLDVKDGEFVVFVGPSGCGKSTTLRMIAGLETITSGKIYIDNTLVNYLEPRDRDIAMVFQNYALYPHMSIYDNLAYSLKCHHEKKDIIEKKVNEVSEMLGIKEYLGRKPKELSGGQRQRVALGRCLIRNPKVFLFDEPLSNLDAKLRVSMRSEISKLHDKVKGTFIYVTHDQTEAMTMGDRIVVMKDGLIQQIDTPTNLYEHPCNVFVATFLGSPQMNIFKGRLIKDEVILGDESSSLTIKLEEQTLNKLSVNSEEEKEVYLGLRPSDIILGSEDDYDFKVTKIELIERLGNETLLYFYLPGRQEYTLSSLSINIKDNLSNYLYFKINKQNIHLFDKEEKSILKVNDINFIKASFIKKEDRLTIKINGNNEEYDISSFKDKLILEDSLDSLDEVLLSSKVDDLKEERDNNSFKVSLRVKGKDIYSDKLAVYSNQIDTNNKITFFLDKTNDLKEGDIVNMYLDLDKIDLFTNNKERLSVSQGINKPLIENVSSIKRIKNDYYLFIKDKELSKAKYYIIENIFILNDDEMLLNLKDNKERKITLRLNRNDNVYVTQRLFVRFEK